jgi:hypothetical protein
VRPRRSKKLQRPEQSQQWVPDILGNTWDWADNLDATALRRMAQVTLTLFKQPQRWIHRRVERIYFKDHATAHHQVSVDFTLPAGMPAIGKFEGKDIYVAPLFLLQKNSSEPLRAGKLTRPRFFLFGERPLDPTKRLIPTPACSNLDFTSQDGHRLPVVTHEQSSLLGMTMLLEAAGQVLGKQPTGRLRKEIAAIPQRSIQDLIAPVPGTKISILEWLLDIPVDKDDARNKLREDKTFPELVYTLASHIIVACLFTGGPLQRSIYKLSFESHVTANKNGALWRSLGWRSQQFYVPLSEIGASSSYHVEIEVPSELLINSVNLVGKRYRWFGELRNRERHADYLIQQVGSASEGKIYIPKPINGRRVGLAWVKLRARRTGFLTGALLASIITTAMLALAALKAPDVLRGGKSEAGAAALLLIPTLLAAYIARPGEHAIVSKMLRWARFALVADGILPALAVYFLITADDTEATSALVFGPVSINLSTMRHTAGAAARLEKDWIILTAVSVIFVLLFIVSNIAPRPYGETIYQPMPTNRDV